MDRERLARPMGRMSGAATTEGTLRFAEKAEAKGAIPAAHFRTTSRDLRLSSIGLGTYLGASDASTDQAVEEAVVVSLTSGRTNVVDTAINYRFQRAERSVGRAIRRLVERGLVDREEMFVATKNGYLAPDAESSVPIERYVEVELVRKSKLRPADIVDGSHAMSVPFLTDQFERSRANLGLETIDLLYLHNAPDAQLPLVGREEFHERLAKAFELFERFRSAGILGAYGLATWDSLRAPRGSPEHFPLEEAIGLAESVGGTDHGLRFLQFPFNPAMPEAATLRNQSDGGVRRTLFDYAQVHRLGTFTSIPLLQGRLARDGPTAGGLTRAQSSIQFARSAPGTIGPLIGQKDPAHLAENLKVAELRPWDEARFRSLL